MEIYKRKHNNKGITLVALIVTIIIMLILIGVGIVIVIDGGYIGTANDAVENRNSKVKNEQNSIDYLMEELDDIKDPIVDPEEPTDPDDPEIPTDPDCNGPEICRNMALCTECTTCGGDGIMEIEREVADYWIGISSANHCNICKTGPYYGNDEPHLSFSSGHCEYCGAYIYRHNYGDWSTSYYYHTWCEAAHEPGCPVLDSYTTCDDCQGTCSVHNISGIHYYCEEHNVVHITSAHYVQAHNTASICYGDYTSQVVDCEHCENGICNGILSGNFTRNGSGSDSSRSNCELCGENMTSSYADYECDFCYNSYTIYICSYCSGDNPDDETLEKWANAEFSEEECEYCYGTGLVTKKTYTGYCTEHDAEGIHYYCDTHSYIGPIKEHGYCSHGKALPHNN